MLRGAKKNMIVVRTRDSRMFEEAYFVMRRNASTAAVDDLDMLWEANRILESTVSYARNQKAGGEKRESPRRRSGKLQRLLWFGAGLICGGGLVGLLWLLL